MEKEYEEYFESLAEGEEVLSFAEFVEAISVLVKNFSFLRNSKKTFPRRCAQRIWLLMTGTQPASAGFLLLIPQRLHEGALLSRRLSTAYQCAAMKIACRGL